MGDGYIKLYRQLLDNAIWTSCTPPQKVVMITILLMANHKPNEWTWQGEKFTVKPGQFISSLDSIAGSCGRGVSIQSVRTSLQKFEKLDFLTNRSTKTGRLITIVNWASYQLLNDEPTELSTKTQQRPNKELTPNKNERMKEGIYSADFEQFWVTYPRQKDKQAACKCWLSRIKDGFSADELIRAAGVYAAECTGKDQQFIKHPKTFLAPNGPFTECLNQPEPAATFIDPENVPPEFTAPWSCIADYHPDSGGQSDE